MWTRLLPYSESNRPLSYTPWITMSRLTAASLRLDQKSNWFGMQSLPTRHYAAVYSLWFTNAEAHEYMKRHFFRKFSKYQVFETQSTFSPQINKTPPTQVQTCSIKYLKPDTNILAGLSEAHLPLSDSRTTTANPSGRILPSLLLKVKSLATASELEKRWGCPQKMKPLWESLF